MKKPRPMKAPALALLVTWRNDPAQQGWPNVDRYETGEYSIDTDGRLHIGRQGCEDGVYERGAWLRVQRIRPAAPPEEV